MRAIGEAMERIMLDWGLRDAWIDGQLARLTPREFELLERLMLSPTQLVATSELLEAIWGSATVGDGHAVEVYVSRLRSKLEAPLPSVEVIRTIRGRGFMFVPPPLRRQALRLVSDHRLILREIVPNDQPFLGWEPDEVLDTVFILAPQPWLYDHPNVLRALAKSLVLAGVRTITGPFNVRRADGGLHIADGEATVHSRSRRFTGLEATLYL
jgi:DNA-binding winged helix-turn-helix (wHTH) protein